MYMVDFKLFVKNEKTICEFLVAFLHTKFLLKKERIVFLLE